ncbi:MAG: type II toxin-antitoxin system RelE/ParE family toxin [bacterium]|nr:type II toxin-antitoxin system RelE/ParE family toxin [bacterium]
MTYKVSFSDNAEKDILYIYRYIRESGNPLNAEKIFALIEEACLGLSKVAEQGHVPLELDRIGVFDFREIHVKVYRIIYKVIGKDAYIHSVLDGKRDIREILQQRILR